MGQGEEVRIGLPRECQQRCEGADDQHVINGVMDLNHIRDANHVAPCYRPIIVLRLDGIQLTAGPHGEGDHTGQRLRLSVTDFTPTENWYAEMTYGVSHRAPGVGRWAGA